ncbi:malonate decarboxylase holo-ACP synthase [Peribacillus glennii]|uniref:malonate decarboxylase holo-ACP synthase n=1 Tax=Peribacillus glennii TaxID=2303991 RepID=UPI00131469A8|nr:malonate decarboxylase holo-ACP synthase [Peribacillus glennii]
MKLEVSQDLISFNPIPEWVSDSLKKAPYVVVRRASGTKDMAAVGIRGDNRSERFAAFLPFAKIKERITPEQIVENKLWHRSERIHYIAALSALLQVNEIMGKHSVTWGPTGSVGFELATCVPTVNTSSDLDLVIPRFIDIKKARQILKDLCELDVRLDVQLETGKGAISLLEFSRGDSHVLLRTKHGPRLVDLFELQK